MGYSNIPSFIIAGTSSGSGKTTIALGLMAAFQAKGLKVQPYKCGPDFIDPGLHKLITGTISRNLDIWMSGEEFTRHCFNTNLQNADVAIVEGVMGMFDGGKSSSASLSRSLNIGTILVLDVRSTAESAAAILKGFEALDPAVAPKGVILNQIGSKRHLQLVSDAIERHCQAKILGHIPRSLRFEIPSRHLGLLTSDEAPISEEAVKFLADTVTEHIDLDLILQLFTRENEMAKSCSKKETKADCRIGVARDKAFCFYYEDNFDLLKSAGAELVFFSPLHDSHLPENIDALYLGGGYPELYAEELSTNEPMIHAIQNWIESNGAVYAECGGFMYLTQGIVSTSETFHKMCGVFPVKARMQTKRASLGYREVTTTNQSFFGAEGTVLRGHEFHYSNIDNMPNSINRLYQVNNDNQEGYQYKNVLGGYMHLHFGYSPQVVNELLKFCKQK